MVAVLIATAMAKRDRRAMYPPALIELIILLPETHTTFIRTFVVETLSETPDYNSYPSK